MTRTTPPDGRCPCSSGDTYALCCGPVVTGDRPAATAEALMRSRFTAYAHGDSTYLLDSWHPSTRPQHLELDEHLRWLTLEVASTTDGGPFDTHGRVRFVARYRSPAGRGELREDSSFVREAGRWSYVDGVPF